MDDNPPQAMWRGWLALILGICFYLHQTIVRVSISPFSHSISESFHINVFILTTISASFLYAFILAKLFLGPFVDHYGAKWSLTVAVGICTLGDFTIAYATSPFWVELGRALSGIGGGISFVIIFVIARGWFSEKMFTIILGMTVTVGTLGAALAISILSQLLRWYTWNQIFLAFAYFSILLTVAIYFGVSEPKAVIEHRKNTILEHHFLKEMWLRTVVVLKNKHVLLNGFYLGLNYIMIGTFGGLWCVPFFKLLYPNDPNIASSTPSFVYAGLAAGALLFPMINKYWTHTPRLIQFGTFLYAAFFILAFFVKLPLALSLVALFLGGLSSGVFVLNYALIREWVADVYSGTASAISTFIQIAIGAALLPIMGKVLQFKLAENIADGIKGYTVADYRIVFSVLLTALILAFIISFFLKQNPKPLD